MRNILEGQPSESELTWLVSLLENLHRRSMPEHVALRTLVGHLLVRLLVCQASKDAFMLCCSMICS